MSLEEETYYFRVDGRTCTKRMAIKDALRIGWTLANLGDEECTVFLHEYNYWSALGSLAEQEPIRAKAGRKQARAIARRLARLLMRREHETEK